MKGIALLCAAVFTAEAAVGTPLLPDRDADDTTVVTAPVPGASAIWSGPFAGPAAAGVLPNGERTLFLARGPGAGATPMNVAYHPGFGQYYTSNGGNPAYAAWVFDAAGNRIQDFEPLGIDVRTWSFNPNTGQLEIVSFDALNGDGGNIYGLIRPGVDGAGLLTGTTANLLAAMPGLISSQTMPAYDPVDDVFFSRDSDDRVHVVSRATGTLLFVINLDLGAAGVTGADVTRYAIGLDVVQRCLVVTDATNARALVFGLDGSFEGASQLDLPVPTAYAMGYANGQLFVFDFERNGWQGFRIKTRDPCDDCPCPEDINRDGVVDFADILRILAAWGPCDENACDFPGVCGQFERCGVGEPFDCFCWTLFDGSGACYQDFLCGDVEDCPDGNCPPGFVCVVGSCCEVNKCVPMITCDDLAYPVFEGATGLTGSGAVLEPSTPSFGAVMDLGPQRRGDLEAAAGPHDLVGRPRVDRTVETDEVFVPDPADVELTRTFGHTGRSAPDFGDIGLTDADGGTVMTVQIGLDGFSGSENIITFDELGGVVPDPGPFSINDVTFSEVSGGSGGPGWRLLDLDYDGPPTPPILTDNAGISDIRIAFDTPQDRAGVFVGIGPATYELQAYDEFGNLLESAQVVAPDTGAFLGFENFAGISLLRVVEPSGENGRVGGIDDVHYETVLEGEKWCNGPYDCRINTCYFSNVNSNANGFIRYDDFVCTQTGDITDVEFIGGGFDVDLFEPCDLFRNLAAVEIAIYEWLPDEICVWRPGAILWRNVIPVEALEIEPFCIDQFGVQQYFFRAVLPEPCRQQVDRQYGISIAGVLANPDNPCVFCWAATSQERQCLGYSIDRNTGESCRDPEDTFFCLTTFEVDPCDDCPCPEDINRDGVVDFADILRVLAAWGPCEEECDDCEDGFVDRCGGTDACHVCLTPDGRCVCVIESACDEEMACREGECPPGFFCCLNTCCGFPICLPVCEMADGAVPQFEPGVPTSGGLW